MSSPTIQRAIAARFAPWSLALATAAVVVSVAACGPRPLREEARPEASAGAHAPEVSAPAPDAAPSTRPRMPERVALPFDLTVESSCSRSYDFTNHRGELDLSAASDGRAELVLQVRSESTSGGWRRGDEPRHYSWPAFRCVWRGTAVRDGARLALNLTLAEPGPDEEIPYECEVRGRWGEGVGEDERTFRMDCELGREWVAREDASLSVDALLCKTAPHRLPWLLEIARGGGDHLPFPIERTPYRLVAGEDPIGGPWRKLLPEARPETHRAPALAPFDPTQAPGSTARSAR